MADKTCRAGFGKKIAVIAVDVTKALADPTSEEHLECGVEVSKQIAKLLNAARQSQIPVFFSKGGRNYACSSGSGLNMIERGPWLYKSKLVEKSEEKTSLAYEFPTIFEVRPDETVIKKLAPSAFFGTMLSSYLLRLGIDTLVVTGMHTSVCIRATVTDAFSYGFRTIVPRECVADRRQDAHEFHLKEMDMKFADVVSLEEVLKNL